MQSTRPTCLCTTGCTTDCPCRRAGTACQLSCSCISQSHGDPVSCGSPFSQLGHFFGAELRPDYLENCRDTPLCNVSANAYFRKFLDFEGGQKLRQPDAATAMLERILASFDTCWVDPRMRQSRPSLDLAAGDESKTATCRQNLFAYAIGIDNDKENIAAKKDPNSCVWSFCHVAMVSRHRVRQCDRCGSCYENAWHCTICKSCKVGLHLACDGCGGWSLHGVRYGEASGKAYSATLMQRPSMRTHCPTIGLSGPSEYVINANVNGRDVQMTPEQFLSQGASFERTRKRKLKGPPVAALPAGEGEEEVSPQPMKGLVTEVSVPCSFERKFSY